jgi:penicillin-binding protein 2
MNENDSGRRLGSLALFVATLFLALLVRLVFLQTTQQQAMAAKAQRNYSASVSVPTIRGRVLDCRGRILIDNVPVNVVRLDVSRIPTGSGARARTLVRLRTALGIPFDQLEAALANPKNSTLEPVEIARGVPESTVVYLQEHPELFPGIDTIRTWRRVYPYKKLAAHVLGYVGRVTEQETDAASNQLAYQSYDFIGKAGIEKSFEKELRGVPGRIRIIRNANGKILQRIAVSDPTPGKDVRLTICVELQQLAESTLRQGLKAARQNYFTETRTGPTRAGDGLIKATAGGVVVLDVNDGSVLAMASYPDFDPRDFVDGISEASYAKLTDPSQHSPLTNRVVAGSYAPGSTFKIVTAVAALKTQNGDKPMLTPYTPYDDNGSFVVPSLCKDNNKCRWSNAGNAALGRLNLQSALRVSSDAYFYKLAYDFYQVDSPNNVENIQKTAREFGFGKRTGIRLPEESAGIVPDKARLARLHKEAPAKFPRGKFQLGDTINVAIGQGDTLATLLQLGRAYAALANGGVVMETRINFDEKDIARSQDSSQSQLLTQPSNLASTTTTTIKVGPPPTVKPGDEAFLRGDTVVGSSVSAAATILPTITEPPIVIPERSTTTLPPVTVTPVVEHQIDLPDEIRNPMLLGLQDVVRARGGTAVKAFLGFPLSQFPIAGKTGTAERSKKQDNALFVGVGPVQNPKYVVAAVIEEGGFGRQTGALVRRMFEGLGGFTVNPVRIVQDKSREQ